MVQLVLWDLLAHKALSDHQDLLVDLPDPLEHKALLVKMVRMALLDQLGHKAQTALMEVLVHKVHKVQQAQQDQLAHKALLVKMAHKVI